MKKISFTYRLSALFLSVLMLFSTVGFSLDVHYCGGKVKSFSFYGKAETCKMMSQTDAPSCHMDSKKTCHQKQSNASFSKKGCCDKKTFTLQNLDVSKVVNGIEWATADLQLITVYILANFNLFQTEVSKTIYSVYSPPVLNHDVAILHQVFLI